MNPMNPWQGAIAGIVGNLLYESIMINEYRTNKGCWPWYDEATNMTVGSYLFGLLVKLTVAGSVSFAITQSGQVNGIWAAGLVGIASDQILKTAADKMKKATEGKVMKEAINEAE